jgi:hypothetical protein
MSARISSVAILGLAVLLASGLSAGCVSDKVGSAIETVATLQSGTISELRDKRGSGPFQTYEIAPDAMLEVVEQAARKARGAGGAPVQAVFVYENGREVVAKERTLDEANDTDYKPTWRTAMFAVVYPVVGRKDASRVEIHAVQRGPFHRGVVQWTRDMPRWIDEVLAERAAADAAAVQSLPQR